MHRKLVFREWSYPGTCDAVGKKACVVMFPFPPQAGTIVDNE